MVALQTQSERPLRVGFICRWDVNDSSAMSGMPASTWKALSKHHLELVCLNPVLLSETKTPPSSLSRSLAQLLRELAKKMMPPLVRNLLHQLVTGLRSPSNPSFDAQCFIEKATSQGQYLNQLLEQDNFDILFGLCVSTSLYGLDTNIPIVYASDATANLINSTYPVYQQRPPQYHDACHHIELQSLSKVSGALFASQRTLESAIADYGVSPGKSYLIPFGANIIPSHSSIQPDCPTPERLELILVAADPQRKRLDFCIEITKILNQRGIKARLNYIGPPKFRALLSPVVNYVGFLQLSDPGDRQLHERYLAQSHLMLLPSSGEMFGIAPCEAAHFGRPSLVSDVGGLSTVVINNETGYTLPSNATANDYADKIENLCHDSDLYQALSQGAQLRAKTVLNWDAWAQKTVNIFQTVIQSIPLNSSKK